MCVCVFYRVSHLKVWAQLSGRGDVSELKVRSQESMWLDVARWFLFWGTVEGQEVRHVEVGLQVG